MDFSGLVIKNEQVGLTFEGMPYDVKEAEAVDLALIWLKEKDHCITLPTNKGDHDSFVIRIPLLKDVGIIQIKQELFKDFFDVTPFAKFNILNKFAELVKESSKLICELESIIRGFRCDDTNKAIKYICDLAKFAALNVYSKDIQHSEITYNFPDIGFLGSLGFMIISNILKGVGCISLSVKACAITRLFIDLAMHAGYNQSQFCVNISKEDNDEEVSIGKSPMIVCDTGDFCAAAENFVYATWGYNGFMPWSVDTVFVQESIYNDFCRQIKFVLNRIRIGSVLDRNVDISLPCMDAGSKEEQYINNMIAEGIKQGAELIQSGGPNDICKLNVFVGRAVKHSQKTPIKSPAIATILPFRTVKEGAVLANDRQNGFAASIWCDSIQQVNELIDLLQVGTISVNSNCIPDATKFFQNAKHGGACYEIGGVEGFTTLTLETFKLPAMNTEKRRWITLNWTERVNVAVRYMEALEEFKSSKQCENAYEINELISAIKVVVNDYICEMKCNNDAPTIARYICDNSNIIGCCTALIRGHMMYSSPVGKNQLITQIFNRCFECGIIDVNVESSVGTSKRAFNVKTILV